MIIMFIFFNFVLQIVVISSFIIIKTITNFHIDYYQIVIIVVIISMDYNQDIVIDKEVDNIIKKEDTINMEDYNNNKEEVVVVINKYIESMVIAIMFIATC